MATAPAKTLEKPDSNSSAVEIVSDSLAMGVVFAIALTVLGRVVGFVRGILFCYFMSDQELGQWSMVWGFLMLMGPLAMLSLPGCFGRYVEHYRQKNQLGAFVRKTARVSLATTCVFSIALLIFPGEFSWLMFRDSSQITIVYWFGVTLILLTIFNFCFALLESLRQVRLVTVMRFVLGMAFAGMGCAMLLGWEDQISAVTLAYGIAAIIATIPAFWFLWKHRGAFEENRVEPIQSREMWKKVAPYAMWLWFVNLFHNVFEMADRNMLIHWTPGDADVAQAFVGQYHSGRVVPLLLVSVAIVICGILMPYLTAMWEKGEKPQVHRQVNFAIKLISIVFTLGSISVIVFSPVLFDWIFQGRYDGGLAVLPLTLTYCVWFSIYMFAQEYLWVREQGKLIFVFVAICLAVNIGLNILLIPSYGLMGAVVATSIANLLNLVLVLGVNHRMGCHTDLGIWICAALPLAIVLPWVWAVAATVGVIALAALTTAVFSEDEKAEFGPFIQTALERVNGMRKRS